MDAMSRLTRGTLISLLGVLVWSFSAIFISRLTGYYRLQPLLLAFWRDVIVSLGLLVVLLVTRRRLPRFERKRMPFFIFYGLLLSAYNAVWTLSVPLNGAAVATVLCYGSMGFTVILARWLFHERITFAKIIGVVLSFTGCALAANAFDASAWSARPLGIAVGLLSALLFACYSLAGKEAAQRGLDTWEVMFFTFSFASLFLLLGNLAMNSPAANLAVGVPQQLGLLPQLPPFGWLLLVTLALFPTLLGYVLYNLSMNYLPVSVANLIATLEPALTSVEAYLLLGELLTLVQVGGGLLVIAAVVIVRISESGAARARPAALPDAPGVEGIQASNSD